MVRNTRILSPQDTEWTSQCRAIMKDAFPEYGCILPEVVANPECGFVASCVVDQQAVGFAQVFTAEWDGRLISWVDVFAVHRAFRGMGIGTGIVRAVVGRAKEIAGQKGLPFAGTVSMTGTANAACQNAFRSNGGTVRTDLLYAIPGGSDEDAILWISGDGDPQIPATKDLAWVLWNFGGLPVTGFVSRYGSVDGLSPIVRSPCAPGHE